MRMENEKEKMEARSKLAADTFPMYFSALEKIMQTNGSTGFYVGSSMTIADIAMWRLLGWFKGGNLDGIPVDLVDKYPLLLQNYENTDAHSEIRAWMDSRYSKK